MKKFLSFLLAAILLGAVSSCSKEDEPGDYEPTYDGVSVYMNAILKLYDNGEPAYTPTDIKGVYVASASSYEVCYNFIVNLLGTKSWDGKDLTVKLGENGESGSLKIIGQSNTLLQQGIYSKIVIDILGDEENYPPYTLEIITEEQAENGYYGGGVPVKRLDGEN